jgi:hypothetical protein
MPGDNEIGIIEYELPESAAKEINLQGMKYFLEIEQELVSRENRRNAINSEWYENPYPSWRAVARSTI